MLSAVAARKARLAQSASPSRAVSTPPMPSSPPSSELKKPSSFKPPPSTQKPPPKRKPSASAGNASKKKKSQHRKGSLDQPARYFTQIDAFKTQEDVIVLDDSDGGSSESSRDSPLADDQPFVQSSVLKTGVPNQKRAWSPSAPLPDSSDEEDDGMDESAVIDDSLLQPMESLPHEAPSVLSTFRPVLNDNVFHLVTAESSVGNTARKRTILLLKAPDTVALLGMYTLTILRGSITLAGVSLHASPIARPVFAPRSSPLPIIQCLPLRSSSSKTSTPAALPPHIAISANGYDAAILLEELQTGIEGLGKICRTFDGFFAPSRWHRGQARFDLGLDAVYFLTHQTPDISPLTVPPTWDAAVHILPNTVDENVPTAQRCAYLVRGQKNAGKSTFARLLLNRLLLRFRRVAYLECDLGQSEFTPGGMVSLNVVEQPVFGPPFSHLSIPLATHYIGGTSPRTSPRHYLDSIQALVQLYDLDLRNAIPEDDDTADREDGRVSSVIPLVVNTMGWTKGLGVDLARKVEDIAEPSHIFSFDGSISENDWNTTRSTYLSVSGELNGLPKIYSVESAPPSPISSHYTAADHRNLSILSYFHAVFPNSSTGSSETSHTVTTWNTSLPLCAQLPYEIECQTAFDRLILAGAGMEDVVPSEVPHALNCAVVALVSCEPGTLDDAPTAPSDSIALPLKYEQGAAAPSPHTSRCVGLALVRAVSTAPAAHAIQLLTPVPPRLLEAARVLVMGELQLPVWGMLDFRTLDDGGDVAGYERGKVPYLRWGKGEGAGGERRRVRRNLMRRGQM